MAKCNYCRKKYDIGRGGAKRLIEHLKLECEKAEWPLHKNNKNVASDVTKRGKMTKQKIKQTVYEHRALQIELEVTNVNQHIVHYTRLDEHLNEKVSREKFTEMLNDGKLIMQEAES